VSLYETFWEHAKRDASGCLIWQRNRHPQGYGVLKTADHRSVYAHREAWARTFGRVPSGLHVLHTCDNPPCIEPAHLFLGTHADNMGDMVRKGRASQAPTCSGERHPFAKLTDAQVVEIRRARSEGVPVKVLAKTYRISRGHVSMVARSLTRAGAG
jgi:Autographiviridae endonuclease